MALFRKSSSDSASAKSTKTAKQGKADLLRRASMKDWKSVEEMQEVLGALGKQRDLKPVELIPLLTSSEASVRRFAEVQLRDRLDQRGVTHILGELQGKTSRTQALLLHTLVRTKPELAIAPLQKMVMEGDRALGKLAMEALSSLPAHRIGSEFAKFLGHERGEVRHMALSKVLDSPALLADRAIQRTIIELADDEDERMRMTVLDALTEIDAGEAVRVCLERIKDPSIGVQQKAVRVLGQAIQKIGESSEAEDQLLGLLADGSEAVRNGVLDIIMKRPDSDRDRILRKLLLYCKELMGWVRDRTLQSLRRYAEVITDPVIRLMSDEDDDVRGMALMLGSTLESAEAVPHIVGLLKDDDWWLRMIAAETLGKIGDKRAVDSLIEAMADADSAMACIEALAKIGDERALPHIIKQLARPQLEVRVEAVNALKAFGDKRVLPVLELCVENDHSPTVVGLAQSAIDSIAGGQDRRSKEIGEKLAKEALTGVLETIGELESLLVEAREAGASDLHIIVDASPTMRVHGHLIEMRPGETYSAERTDELLKEIMGERELDLLETTSQADFCHAIPEVGRYRSNIYQERKGLAGSFRMIPNEVPTLDDIGLPSHLADLVNYHQGLIVVAGPSGSGKSTTLAALVNLFNENKRDHILLLEDPIEFVHPAKACLVNQREVGRHTRTFASALRGALREDPDIIIVGEMRDSETVKLAIEASETGHLVIGTMNTTSAPKTVDRIVESFPIVEQQQIRVMLSETLKAVVAQQLVPAADGNGRVACFEVMMATLGVRMMIRDSKTYQILGQMQIGERKGQVTVDTALGRLLQAGKISAETAYTRAQNKDNFEARISADFLASKQRTPKAAAEEAST